MKEKKKMVKKEELIRHFRWLVAIANDYACGFTHEEQNKNEEIANILFNFKMEEKKNG